MSNALILGIILLAGTSLLLFALLVVASWADDKIDETKKDK